MLPENRRQQLDGIVQEMVANNESDENIRFVVNDFKSKYSEAQKPQSVSEEPKTFMGFGSPIQAVKDFASGVRSSFDTRVQRAAEDASAAVSGDKSLAGAALGMFGQGAGAVGDIGFEALKLATPRFIEKLVEKGLTTIAETQPAQAASGAYSSFKEKNPDAAGYIEDVANIASILPIGKTATTFAKGVAKQAPKVIPDVITKDVAILRAEKVREGFMEQNTRLKTAEKAFNENTKTFKDQDGTKVTVTPVDTLGKYDIAPTVDKGTLQMGDYKNGDGALGKIRTYVNAIDDRIDEAIKDSSKGIRLEDYKKKAMDSVLSNPELKRSGKTASTIAKLDRIFEDYKVSYGSFLDEAEINEIRKVMNRDWNPDTLDTSRVIGDASRDIIYSLTDDNTIRDLLREQGNLLAAKKYAEAINNSKVTGGRLGNMAMRTTGAIIGSTVPNIPVVGPILGMAGGEYAARALQQSQFKSFSTEIKALLTKPFQRPALSNTSQPINNAKTIPSNSVIQNTVPQPKATGIPAESRTRIFSLEGKRSSPLTYKDNSTVPQPKSESKNLSTGARQGGSLPNSTPKRVHSEGERGMVRLPWSGKTVKAIDQATKEDLTQLSAWLKDGTLPKGVSDRGMISMYNALSDKYNIPQDGKTTGQIRKYIENLLENTKTTDALPGTYTRK